MDKPESLVNYRNGKLCYFLSKATEFDDNNEYCAISKCQECDAYSVYLGPDNGYLFYNSCYLFKNSCL